jgi:hypothetical protein
MAVQFRGNMCRWREDSPSGLSVVDVPAEMVEAIGGRRQKRVTGTCTGAAFTGSTMLGGFCVGVGKAALKAAGVSVGDEVELSIEPVPRP